MTILNSLQDLVVDVSAWLMKYLSSHFDSRYGAPIYYFQWATQATVIAQPIGLNFS